MTISAASLVERVRDLVGDYGDVVTTVATAAGATDTTLYVASAAGIEPMDTLLAGAETMEVTKIRFSYPDEIDVIRGSRGSTATTQAQNVVVRARCRWTSKRILDALNVALSGAYPKLYVPVTDDTLAILSDVYTYVSVGIDTVWRVEIENSDGTGYFFPIRQWDLLDPATVRVYGDYVAGRTIRFVGTTRFAAMAVGGNLDADYPTGDTALSYLCYSAAADLLTSVQIQIASLDSFVGQTDAFTAGQPYVPGNIANQLRKEAAAMLEDCKMSVPDYYMPAPGRHYLARH